MTTSGPFPLLHRINVAALLARAVPPVLRRRLHRLSLASVCAAAALPAALHGRIEQALCLTSRPAQYSRVDFVVILTADWGDPYRADDVRLDLELTAPSGGTIVAPAYFERGESGASSVWHARFTPREAGDYRGRFVLTQSDAVTNSAPVSFQAASSPAKGFLRLDSAWAFRFDRGDVFRGIGQNLCWESRAVDDSRHFKRLHENQRFNYEYLLGTLHARHGNFFRVWMCPWNLPLEWKKVSDTTRYTDDPDRFNASAIRRMDELVELAASTDTYFMLALDYHGALLGSGWEASSYNVKNGGPSASPAEFFTHPAAKARYKDRLRYLVGRWGYSPHLAVWELFNEVDNAMHGQKSAPIPDEVVAAWHVEMSDYLKRIDPYGRAVSTSISHRDVAGLNRIASIDFNQRHIYKQTDSIPGAIRRAGLADGKPMVIGEFAYEWDWTKNFDEVAGDMDRDFKRGLWLGLFSPTPILPMSWWWEYFDERKITPYFERVRALHERMLAAGGGAYAEVDARWAGDPLRHVLAVRCGATRFALLSNTTDSPARGRLTFDPAPRAGATIQIYHPDADRTCTPASAAPALDSLVVEARSDVIVIVTEE